MQDAVGTQLGAQLLGRALGHQMAVGQNQHFGTNRLYLAEDMAGQNHGMTLPQFTDQAADFDDLRRVQTDGGLIQNDDLGMAQQGLGNPHPLAVALGQVPDQPRHYVCQTSPPGCLFHLCSPLAPLDPFELCGKGQILFDRHLGIEGRCLRQVPDAGFGCVGFLRQRVPFHRHCAAGGCKVSGDDVHDGGFACSIGAQQAIDLAILHGKRQITHRWPSAVFSG